METPAAALIRRTDTPSWPYCLRQLKVASTNASRRTAGVARWNFGTCRLVAICFLFGLYRSATEWPARVSRFEAQGRRLRWLVAHESSDSLDHIAPNVQVPVLHRRVVPLSMDARPNPILHARAYRPVLTVHQIPEFHRVRWIKARFRHFMGLEQKMTGDIGTGGAPGVENVRRDMIACDAQKHIGVNQFALVSNLFVRVEAGKGAPH